MSTLFQYEAILENDAFRVLILHPPRAENPEELHGEIKNVAASDRPRYEAVSYAWGPADLASKLYISSSTENGVTDDNPERHSYLHVSSALNEVLTALRHPTKPRVLWVDALCINQGSLSERTHQVKLMKEIYSSAVRVIGYVGSPSPADAPIFEVQSAGLFSAPTRLKKRIFDDNDMVTAITALAAMTVFIDRPYFSRVWIVQEIALAKDLILQCGQNIMPWEHFSQVWLMFQLASRYDGTLLCTDESSDRIAYLNVVREMNRGNRERLRIPEHGYNSEGRRSWSRFAWEKPLERDMTKDEGWYGDLEFFVCGGRMCNVRDDRDRIYGMLGLVSQTERETTEVDYEASIEDVYGTFVKRRIKEDGHLDIFGQLDWKEEPDLVGKQGGRLPSWIPDFRLKSDVEPISSRFEKKYFASGDTQARLLHTDDPTAIALAGVQVDIVEEISDIFTVPFSKDEGRSYILTYASKLLKKLPILIPELQPRVEKLYAWKESVLANPQYKDIEGLQNSVGRGLPRFLWRCHLSQEFREKNRSKRDVVNDEQPTNPIDTVEVQDIVPEFDSSNDTQHDANQDHLIENGVTEEAVHTSDNQVKSKEGKDTPAWLIKDKTGKFSLSESLKVAVYEPDNAIMLLAAVGGLVSDTLITFENILLGPVHGDYWTQTRTIPSIERQWRRLASKTKVDLKNYENLEEQYWRTLIGNRRRRRPSPASDLVPAPWRGAFEIWKELIQYNEGILPTLKRFRWPKMQEDIYPRVWRPFYDKSKQARPVSSLVPIELKALMKGVEYEVSPLLEAHINEKGERVILTPESADYQIDVVEWAFEKDSTKPKKNTKASQNRKKTKKNSKTKSTVNLAKAALGDGDQDDIGKQNNASDRESSPEENGHTTPEDEDDEEESSQTFGSRNSSGFFGKETVEAVRELRARFPLSRQGIAREFERDVLRVGLNRRFCRTRDGRIGWVPAETRKGDAICVLLGAQVPFAIRRVQIGDDSRYLLLGESYMSGLMEGEGLEMGQVDKMIFV